MKKKLTIIFLAALLAVSFIFPQKASAQTYPEGTLIKADDNPTVYYIASDGKRYPFPDPATFYTWFNDFSKVQTETRYNLRKIALGKGDITVHPGTKLVKFSNSHKVYAVEQGAVLRWIKNEKIAKKYYGLNWKNRIVILSPDRIGLYSFGQDIDENAEFSKNKASSQAKTISKELGNRNIIEKIKTKIEVVKEPILKSLKENLRNNFSPKFNSAVTSYELTALHNEETLSLKPQAKESDAQILVNGTQIASGSEINIKLEKGLNKITITVILPDQTSKTYSFTVNREFPSNNVFLESLQENLSADMSPSFKKTTESYTLKAGYFEGTLKIRPRAEDKSSAITINGTTIRSGSLHKIFLEHGKNTIKITVKAQKGNTKTYTLEVNRSKYLQVDDLDLKSLQENLSGGLVPDFDPKHIIYHLRAKADEDKIKITAKPKNKKARVVIEGEVTQSKTIELENGENEIHVYVEIDDFQKDYTIFVNKAESS